MKHQPYITQTGVVVHCQDKAVASLRFGESKYEATLWKVIGTDVFDRLWDDYSPCEMCCPAIENDGGSCVIGQYWDDAPIWRSVYHVDQQRNVWRIETSIPCFSGFWCGGQAGFVFNTKDLDGVVISRDQEHWTVLAMDDSIAEVLRVVPANGMFMVTAYLTDRTPVTIMVDPSDNTVAGEVRVGGRPAYKGHVRGGRCVSAIGSSFDGTRDVAESEWTLEPSAIAVSKIEMQFATDKKLVKLPLGITQSAGQATINTILNADIIQQASDLEPTTDADIWIKAIIGQLQDEIKRHDARNEPCRSRRCREKIAARWQEYLTQKNEMTNHAN